MTARVVSRPHDFGAAGAESSAFGFGLAAAAAGAFGAPSSVWASAPPLIADAASALTSARVFDVFGSGGIVVTSPKTAGLKIVKAKGRVRDLEAKVPARFKGTTGIAHTRWATHGAPSDVNAHPHMSADQKVAVVHNGIIDNAAELRRKLEADGVEFLSETDTEVLTHLLRTAVAETVRAHLAGIDLRLLVDAIEGGAMVSTGARTGARDFLAGLPVLGESDLYDEVCDRLGATNDGERAAAIELALEGLYLARKIGKDSEAGETVYG